MTAISNTLNTPYYHREYSNDIPINRQSDIPKRVALVALPFLSLYQPFSLPISLVMGSARVYTSVNKLIDITNAGTSKEIAFATLDTTIAVIALASSIFAHPIGMVITTLQDILLELTTLIRAIEQNNIEESFISLTKITNNFIYLTLLCSGGAELSIVSLALQAITLIISSRGEFKQGNYLEAAGNILMALIRAYQGYSQLKNLEIEKIYESRQGSFRFANRLKSLASELKINLQGGVGNKDNPFLTKALENLVYNEPLVYHHPVLFEKAQNCLNIALLRSGCKHSRKYPPSRGYKLMKELSEYLSSQFNVTTPDFT